MVNYFKCILVGFIFVQGISILYNVTNSSIVDNIQERNSQIQSIRNQ